MGRLSSVEEERTFRGDQIAWIHHIIRSRTKELETETKTISVADLIRLWSLERDLTEENEAVVREVKATWVQPSETESGT